MAARALLRFARRLRPSAFEKEPHSIAWFHSSSGDVAGRRAQICIENPAQKLNFRQEHTLSRKRLIERMVADLKRREEKHRRLTGSRGSTGRGSTGSQPPPSEPLIGPLSPDTPQEMKLVNVLARPDLLITRNIEWANVAFGFEQQNRYVVMDPRQPQAPVGYIFEESNFIVRQLLRTRRPFIAYILDGHGQEIYKVRRPAWLINSTIYVEIAGDIVGEVHRRWHLWRRIYDLYLGKTQFGRVENPGFWNWTFTVFDENGDTLAVIDRNWRGFGYEFFTDAGQYVVRFGEVLGESANKAGLDGEYVLQAGQQPVNVDPQVEPLAASRPLTLEERAIVLALAISLDNDYFSRHRGGIGVPIPMIGGAPEA